MKHHAPCDRTERVADAIRRLIAETLLTEMSDPRLRDVQITRVRMTRDLHIARIYYHAFASDEDGRAAMEKGFRSAAGFLRCRIGEELSLKFTPEVEFYYDDSIDFSDRIDEIMAGMKRDERDG